jgi:SAM-dependent methyltransferase
MDEFDLKAATWDLDPVKVERAARVAQAILAQAGPLEGVRGLEYGCGTGLLGFHLRPHLAHLTLADTSAGMLAVLREKIAARGLEGMEPLELDLARGPVPGLRFGLVASLLVLHHLKDTAGALRAFHALLEPGGLLAISDLDLEDGSFHGPGVDVHPGFDRTALAGHLEEAGFRDLRFSTPYVMEKDGARYPLFLVLARRP